MSTQYKIDSSQSRFTVKVQADGLLSGFGHNPTIDVLEFEGYLRFSTDAPEEGALNITIKSDSLEVAGDIKEGDRKDIESKMREEVLETNSYPEIVFKSKNVLSADKISEKWYRLQINGDLSLHGVTKEEKLDAQIKIKGGSIKAEGEFNLSQKKYNIKQVSALGGSIKIKDKLKLTFNIVAEPEG